MKKKKNGVLKFVIIFILLISGFLVLNALANNEMPVDEVMEKAFNGSEVKLVYLSRPDCTWCQKQKPILQKVSKKYGIEYLYINTGNLNKTKLSTILEKFEIDPNEFGTPTFVALKNGEVIASNIGYMNESKLISFFQSTGVITLNN